MMTEMRRSKSARLAVTVTLLLYAWLTSHNVGKYEYTCGNYAEYGLHITIGQSNRAIARVRVTSSD